MYCESTFVEIKVRARDRLSPLLTCFLTMPYTAPCSPQPKEVKPDDAYSTVRAFFLVPTNGEVDFDCPCTDEQEDFNYGIGRPPV